MILATERPMPAEQQLAQRAIRARRRHPHLTYKDGVESKPAERRMQRRFHESTHTIRALFPGNGAGKTTTMGVEFDWWAQHNHPYQLTPAHPIVGVWFTLKFQQFEIIREQLERRAFTRGWVWHEQKHMYRWPNGAKLYLFSADSDWTTAQGINPDLVIFDENPPHKIWREMQMRRRGDKKTRYMIGATATQGLTWMFTDVYQRWLRFHEEKGLDEDQAMVQQLHNFIFCWPKGGIEDNPGSDQVDRQWYNEQVSYASPAEKEVRTRGGFRDFNATPVFDQPQLDRIYRGWEDPSEPLGTRRHKGVIEPAPMAGTLELIADARLRQHPDRPVEFQYIPNGTGWQGGRITVYEMPRDDANYAIGADTGWGLPTSDFSTASVGRRWVDPKTGRLHVVQVAEAEGRWSSVPFSWVLWALGWYYNEAFVAIERNNGGLEVARKLYDDRNYRYQYFEKKDKSAAIKHTDTLGFTKHNNDRLITRCQHFLGPVDDAGDLLPFQFHLRSLQAWTQFKHYTWRPRSSQVELEEAGDDDLIMSAPEGEHDDLVIANAALLMAAVELPAFRKPKPVFAKGTAGDLLKHAEVFDPPPKVGAFKYGKR